MSERNTFSGRGAAQRAAVQAARQAQKEWRDAGETGERPAPYVSLGDRVARQEIMGLNFTVPKPTETRAHRRHRREKEAGLRLEGRDPQVSQK